MALPTRRSPIPRPAWSTATRCPVARHHGDRDLERRQLWDHAKARSPLLPNYALSYVGANLTVTAAALTVTANAQTRVYGAAVPTLTYNETGLVNGDTLTGRSPPRRPRRPTSAAYAITQGTLAASTNYALSYIGANLTVTAAALTVTANAQSRVYGAANPTLTYTEHRPGQRRHADRSARHHGDHVLERRQLWDHAKARSPLLPTTP